MARHGLGQTDINLRARLALAGFSLTPEADIAALLTSGQPLEQTTLQQLALAIQGKSKNLNFRKYGGSGGKKVQAFLRRSKRLEIGRKVEESKLEPGNHDPVEVVMKKMNVGKKYAEAQATFYRKFESWKFSVREGRPEFAHLTDLQFEVGFLYAQISGEDPTDAISRSIEKFTDLLLGTEMITRFRPRALAPSITST